MPDGEALIGPRMKNARLRKPRVGDPHHLIPRDGTLVAAPAECPTPALGDLVAEFLQRVNVGRHCMIVEVAFDNMPQPTAQVWDTLMHAPSHLLAHRLELRPHAVPPGLPFDQEATLARFTADGLRQPLTQCVQEAPGIALVLEAD